MRIKTIKQTLIVILTIGSLNKSYSQELSNNVSLEVHSISEGLKDPKNVKILNIYDCEDYSTKMLLKVAKFVNVEKISLYNIFDNCENVKDYFTSIPKECSGLKN